MGKNIELHVYLNTQHVGVITQSVAGAMSFKYSKQWIEKFSDYAISLSLPVQESEYRGGEVLSYFDNLLPDNDEIRKSVAAKVKAKSSRTFDLLSAVGRDCVGALRFATEKLEIQEITPVKGTKLNPKEIEKVINSLKMFPLGMDSDEFRLSIAGVQEKTALLLFNDSWLRPIKQTPTTHILKPPMGKLQNGIDLRSSVANEWLCLKLCEYFGLNIAKVSMNKFGVSHCLVVERFDRLWIGEDRLVRVAQEDLCQALKYSSSQKYESDGGPSIKEIMDLLDASLNRDQDRYDFMKAQVLFWLMGATDGHAKNYSVFLRKEGFYLTPFYDVMSMYPALESKQVNLREMKLSFKVGNSRKDRLDKIQPRYFYETASKCSFSSNLVDQIFNEIKACAKDDFLAFANIPSDFPKTVLVTIVDNMFKRIDKLKGE